MKKFFILIMIISLGLCLLSFFKDNAPNGIDDVHQTPVGSNELIKKEGKIDLDFGKIPLYFIPNHGQVDTQVLMYTRASQYTLWLTRKGLVFDSSKRKGEGEKKSGNGSTLHTSGRCQRDVSRLVFKNANENPAIIPFSPAKGKLNIFKGDDRSRWNKGIKTFKGVTYKSLYNGIDLMIYGIEKEIEYDWIVKPEAEPASIRFQYQDVKSTKIDAQGNIRVTTSFGDLVHQKPKAYQVIGGKRRVVEVQFNKIEENCYGFRVGEYDKQSELIIDPLVLTYSTFLGGEYYDLANDIIVDSSGYIYVVGTTESPDFPDKNGVQWYGGDPRDAFVTKFFPDGKSLVYSTFLGGDSSDEGNAITVSSGYACVTGYTQGIDFPTFNAYQSQYGGDGDIFVTCLSSMGALVSSTYLGGSGVDSGIEICTDSNDSDNVWITGYTRSGNGFPITNDAYQSVIAGDSDAFLIRFMMDGYLLYGSYMGGSNDDGGMNVCSVNGAVYVSGYSDSTNFPSKSGFSLGDLSKSNVFVAKFQNDYSLKYCSRIGGSDNDYASGLAVDGEGCVYVTGSTMSNDFPVVTPYMKNRGGWDAFVFKIKSDGKGLHYSTYLGGKANDYSYDIAIDGSGGAYVTGSTASSDFPLKKPISNTASGIFVAKFFPDGKMLEFSTCAGGKGDSSSGNAIALAGNRNIYVTGKTGNKKYPVKNAFQSKFQGYSDAFVTKLQWNASDNPPSISVVSPADGTKVNGIVDFKATITDDYGIGAVEFYINSDKINSFNGNSAEKKTFTKTVNTLSMYNGPYVFKVEARDSKNQKTIKTSPFIINNITISLVVRKVSERTWLIQKDYAKLEINVTNNANLKISGFNIYRKVSSGNYAKIGEIAVNETNYIDFDYEGQTTVYMVKAVSSDTGEEIAHSNQVIF